MNDYTIEVVTQFNKNMIEQWEEYGYGFAIRNHAREHTKRLIQLQDQGVRDALKKLGWLSPEDSRELLQCCVTFQDFVEGSRHWQTAREGFSKILKEYLVGGRE